MGNKNQFTKILDAQYEWTHTTPNRDPYTDMPFVSTNHKREFVARPVVGGLFARMWLDKLGMV